MHKFLLLLPGLIAFFTSVAQNPFHISIQNSTLAATDSVLPFWFAANQQGKIKASNQVLNLTGIFIGQEYNFKTESGFSYTWGGNFIAAFAKNNYYDLNRAFAGLSVKGWELKGGLFYDETRYAGLSTSNGIIGRSLNARPVPKIRFSTRGYKPVPFMQKWLSFKGEYDEGFLNDERYVDGAHLHHKSLYFNIKPALSWDIRIGFEHFVMWGGTSPDKRYGELPEGWNAYWRYVLGLPGNEDFPQTDQLNSSGNQLGSYQLEVVKKFAKADLSFYLSHPWEDNSGLYLHNWPDNLMGVHINIKNKKSLVTDVVYEFTNTRHQGIKDSLYVWDDESGKWRRLENDRYFIHEVYRSGFTYQQEVMCSPLFFPVIDVNGISGEIRSNRFFAHHVGISGNVSDHIRWKSLLTYIQHLGTYALPYEPVQNQFSALFEVGYVNPGFPLEFGMSAGVDAGNVIDNNFGLQFSVAKRW